MNLNRRLTLALAALRELGPAQVGLYVWYQVKQRMGHLRRRTMDDGRWTNYNRPSSVARRPLIELPSRESISAVLGDNASLLLAEADEIVGGQVRLFGGGPVPLQLKPGGQLEHWTAYERGLGDPGEDIKFVWEPGRFGWAYILGRAYSLSGDERYAQAFWERWEEFIEANPPDRGPHWASAQEVALRLIAVTFSAQLFTGSPASTQERRVGLAEAVAAHAARIPPTLDYARAQHNNHLLSEAAGLYTAGLALPDHPQARRWQALGWRWLNRGLEDQLAPDGTYSQHSTNYHRLALQVALWCHRLAQSRGQAFPVATQARLAAATRWLLALVDPETGCVPNLGPNDGAYIQTLSTCPFSDYRPVLQAAARAFLGGPAFAAGPWDEMSVWYFGGRGIGDRADSPIPYPLSLYSPHILRNPGHPSWAYFRVARFASRPGHADQLHLDLWWRGLNLAQDAGTYQYNAAPPWENALAGTTVHNTVTVNGLDQMQRAGRFLWLEWAQGKITAGERGPEGAWFSLAASHDGYRRLGVSHEREVRTAPGGRWVVVDRIQRVEGYRLKVAGYKVHIQPGTWNVQPVTIRLHWLVPDWPWSVATEGRQIVVVLESPYGPVELRIRLDQPQEDSPGPQARFPSKAQVVISDAPEMRHGRPQGAMLPEAGGQGPLQRIMPQDSIMQRVPHKTRRQRYRLQPGREAQSEMRVRVVRAGEVLYGEGPAGPTWGWSSPTYGVKIPALSISVSVAGHLPVCLISEWIFPPEAGPSGRDVESANLQAGG